jgi:hypothetical protein
MKRKVQSRNPETIGALAALRRAAKSAKQLAIQTGTPFWVVRNGKIVNLNPRNKCGESR